MQKNLKLMIITQKNVCNNRWAKVRWAEVRWANVRWANVWRANVRWALKSAHRPNHRFSLRNSAIWYMCASFQMSIFLHDLVLSSLLQTATCAFQLCAISSPPLLTAQHSAPYTLAGFIAVLYTFNFDGMFLSHITPLRMQYMLHIAR